MNKTHTTGLTGNVNGHADRMDSSPFHIHYDQLSCHLQSVRDKTAKMNKRTQQKKMYEGGHSNRKREK